MRRFILSLAVISMVLVSAAQAPNSFNYQAVVRGADGKILQNTAVSFRFSILVGTSNGASTYVETQPATTNQYGLINLTIGEGAVVSGTFETISWGAEAHFLKVDLDVSGGSAYTDMSTQQLVAVPYAMHASTVENSDNDTTNEYQGLSKTGSTITLSDGGGDVILDDDDASNELQTLSKTGNDITLSDGGGTVSVADDDNDDANELQSLSKTGNNVTLSDGGGTVSVADNDNNSSNEIQNLSRTGTNVTLSGGGLTVSIADNDNNSSNEYQDLTSAGDSFSLTNSSVHVNLSDLGHWVKNGSDLHYTSGNVGVNVSAPAYSLDVQGDAAISDKLLHKGDANTYLEYTDDGAKFVVGNETLLQLVEGSSDYVKFGDNGDVDVNLNNKLFVNSGTNSVGIGTTNPFSTYALHVSSPASKASGIYSWNSIDQNSTNEQYGNSFVTTRSSDNIGNTRGISNQLNFHPTSASTYKSYAIYNEINASPDNASNQQTYGIYNYINRSDSGGGSTYGTFTNLDHSGTNGLTYGHYVDVDVTGANPYVAYGSYNTIYKTGSTNSTLYGSYNRTSRASTNNGTTYGFYNSFTNNPTSGGYKSAGYNGVMTSSPTSGSLQTTYGFYQDLNRGGAGTAETKGFYLDLDNTSTSTNITYGMHVDLDRNSTGIIYGSLVEVDRSSSSSTFTSYGSRAVVDVNGGSAYGQYGLVYVGENATALIGTAYGSYNSAYRRGTGNYSSYGSRNASYNYTTGTGSRYSYGSFNYAFQNSAAGTTYAYGVLGNHNTAGDVEYAGYFSGNVYTTGSYLPSDANLKQNISTSGSSLDKILGLKIYDYQYDIEKFTHMNLPEGKQTGFLAGELAKLFPELTTAAHQPPLDDEIIEVLVESGVKVGEMAKTGYDFTAVNYAGLVPHLTKAIQEQQLIIESQEERISNLEDQLKSLQESVEQLIAE